MNSCLLMNEEERQKKVKRVKYKRIVNLEMLYQQRDTAGVQKFCDQFKKNIIIKPIFEFRNMGQGGSLFQNKSLILNNWTQIQPNSNIVYNKVTNQQIQRHEVLINDKNELTSYVDRMKDQSALICRLIYFHPKSLPNDDKTKKPNVKKNVQQTQNNIRPKSMLNQQTNSFNYINSTQKQSKQLNQSSQLEFPAKVYCVYTDRMMCVKQWSKEKIIDVILGFKYLTNVYGLFKVRQHCICQNERKQIKVWINQNPMSNFPVQTVQTEQDMIADLAAMLVSRKQKIAKQLLDLQHFDEVIERFMTLPDCDYKKYMNSAGSSNNTSNRQSTFFTVQSKQPQRGTVAISPQVNNFYNVFINADNSLTVNSSMQSSKYNCKSKGNFVYPFYTSSSSNVPSSRAKYQGNQQILPQKQESTNYLTCERSYSPTTKLQITNTPSHSRTPVFASPVKDQSSNQNSQISNDNKVSINCVIKENKNKSNYQPQNVPGSQYRPNQKKQDHQMMDNTSILLYAKGGSAIFNKKSSQQNQKDYASLRQQKQSLYMTTSQKRSPSKVTGQTSSLYSTQNPKYTSQTIPMFVSSTHQQLKSCLKNYSGSGIQVKKIIKSKEGPTNYNHIRFGNNERFQSGQINESGRQNQKKFFSGRDQVSQNKNYASSAQIQTVLGKQLNSSYKEKSIEMNRCSEGQTLKYQTNQKAIQKNYESQNRLSNKRQLTTVLRSHSKVFAKSGLNNQQNTVSQSFLPQRTVVSQKSPQKTQNMMDFDSLKSRQFNKKSFPKYFNDKQSEKSIHKHYEKSLHQRQYSKTNIDIEQDQHAKSLNKTKKGFGEGNFKYQPSHPKYFTQQVVDEVQQSQACSQQVLPSTTTFTQASENIQRYQSEAYQPRKKFPSTMQGKSKGLHNQISLDERQFQYSKQGTEIDSQQSCNHQSKKSNFMEPKSNFMETKQSVQERQKHMKKSNNSLVDPNEANTNSKTHSYFSHIITNNSLYQSHKDHLKQQSQARTKGFVQEDFFGRQEEKYFNNNRATQSRQSPIQQQQADRKQTFPYHQPNPNQRKNEKHFTFFNSTQKTPGAIQIEQINPYEPVPLKNRVYVNKKESQKSTDEKQTLARTTTDEKETRIFKATRTPQISVETNDLHRSDPGYRIEQFMERMEKEKIEKDRMMSNETMSVMQDKLDTKQYPKFKKWQPSSNVYASLISQSQQGSIIKKKDCAMNSKQEKNNEQAQKVAKTIETQQLIVKQEQSPKVMGKSNTFESKKKIRKEVFMDYKGLFGDENPFNREETEQEREREKKLLLKRERQEEERLMQNASSKDLLIQEKVQKQKKKHAQLKVDLSRLFSDDF